MLILALTACATTTTTPGESRPRPATSEASIADIAPAPAWLRSQVEVGVDQLVLIHEVELGAPPAVVWAAHTTAAGWQAWASPVAAVDLRVGGTIQTHYTAGASIGDPGTNTLHIINYSPERILTLQAEPSPSWPSSLMADAGRMYNVISFEAVTGGRTRLVSHGMGYRDTDEHRQMLEFFERANEGLYENLRAYVERGEQASFSNP